MFEYSGKIYKVGTIVIFDMGNNPQIGVITEITRDGSHLKCDIVEPSGRLRNRTLDYDIDNGYMMKLQDGEAHYLDSKKWIQRYQNKQGGQSDA